MQRGRIILYRDSSGAAYCLWFQRLYPPTVAVERGACWFWIGLDGTTWFNQSAGLAEAMTLLDPSIVALASRLLKTQEYPDPLIDALLERFPGTIAEKLSPWLS